MHTLGEIGEGVNEGVLTGVVCEARILECLVVVAFGENGVVAKKEEDQVAEIRGDGAVELGGDDEESWG